MNICAADLKGLVGSAIGRGWQRGLSCQSPTGIGGGVGEAVVAVKWHQNLTPLMTRTALPSATENSMSPLAVSIFGGPGSKKRIFVAQLQSASSMSQSACERGAECLAAHPSVPDRRSAEPHRDPTLFPPTRRPHSRDARTDKR